MKIGNRSARKLSGVPGRASSNVTGKKRIQRILTGILAVAVVISMTGVLTSPAVTMTRNAALNSGGIDVPQMQSGQSINKDIKVKADTSSEKFQKEGFGMSGDLKTASADDNGKSGSGNGDNDRSAGKGGAAGNKAGDRDAAGKSADKDGKVGVSKDSDTANGAGEDANASKNSSSKSADTDKDGKDTDANDSDSDKTAGKDAADTDKNTGKDAGKDSDADKTADNGTKDSGKDGSKDAEDESSDDKDTKTVASAPKLLTSKTELKYEGNGYTITATVGKDAKLPENTKLEVREIVKKLDTDNEKKLEKGEETEQVTSAAADSGAEVYDRVYKDVLKAAKESENDENGGKGDKAYDPVKQAERKAADQSKAASSKSVFKYDDYYTEAEKAVVGKTSKKDAETKFIKLYNISLVSDGVEFEPSAPIDVKISYDKAIKVDKTDNVKIVHFGIDKKTGKINSEILDAKDTELKTEKITKGKNAGQLNMTEAGFKAESFSVYGVVYTVSMHTEVISAAGETYDVTVTYGEDAQIPEGAELKVREIQPEDKEYKAAQKQIGSEIDDELKDAIPADPVLLDIAIYDGDKEIEPAEGSSVQVEVNLVGNTVKGTYTDDNSPVLINGMPVFDDSAKMDKAVQVLHLSGDDSVDVMETEDDISKEEVKTTFTTDSFSNWLVFLDEDLADINLTTNDSLTLRPYTEWVWKTADGQQEGNWLFPSDKWTRENEKNQYNQDVLEDSQPVYIYTHNETGTKFRVFSKYDDQLHQHYIVATSTVLKAGVFDITNDKNKTIHVHVTQGNASPAPDPVPGIPELTVNLFDYDVPYKNGQPDFTRSGNLDSSGNKATSVYNETVNIGHNLDFLGWGYDGDGHGVNSYTNEYAKQGIVKKDLNDNGYPVLNDGSNQDLDYLFNTGSHNSSVYGFANAGGLFQKDNQGYYYYNSNINYAKYDINSNQFILYGHTYTQNTGGSSGANAKPIGFFPFHEYDTSETQPSMNHNKNLNHHFGMSMTVDFEIPKDRQMEDQNGNKHEIIYEFSGDDDLWVFVDDELALDIGGIHQPVTGSINFTTGVIKVHGKDNITKTFDVGGHTLKMFYLERGGCDSNLSVRFNLPLVKGKAGINVAKKSMENDSSDPDKYLPGAVFGIWENADCTGEPYMTGTSDANGHIDFGDLPIKVEGQKYYIKEIAPPDGYLPNTTIFTATAAKDSNGKYSFTITDGTTPVETIGQQPVYTVVRDGRADPVDLTVEKKWQNPDGTPMTAPDVTAQFEVLRYVTKVKIIESEVPATDETTLELFKYKNWGSLDIASFKTYKFSRGAKVRVSYEYNSSYQGGSDYKRYEINEGASNNVGYSGSFEITIPETGKTDIRFYDNWKGQTYGGGTALLNLSAEVIEMPHVDPTVETETYFDEDFSYPLDLPHNGGWTNTAHDLPAMSSDDEYTYYYSYYIKEKTVPAGFEVVYLDGQNHQITDPSSLQTNTSGTQTIVNRELTDVPVIKDWADFSGDEYTWTAVFQLEQRELKVNSSDPDASDAITSWAPIDGKTLQISKGQTPTPTFNDLPRFRMHSNGTLYRILYSVEETAYEVKEGDSVVAKWDSEHGHTIGHKYTPQFTQDAGGNEQGEKPYEIKLANTLHNPTVTNDIDLSLQKLWTSGGADYDPGNDASAKFVLKRYYHEEYRNYSHVSDMTDTVTITLDVAGTGTNPTITVPRGAMVSIAGNVMAGQNALIEFKRADNTLLSKQVDNSSSQSLKPFDITFEATQDETVTLYRGDNYVSGGREGFRLTDHGDQNTPKVDKHFSEEFTLPQDGNWIKQFSDLPQIEEDEMDEDSHVQTITVYTYYFEEKACSPEGFDPVFRTANGHILGDVNNPVDNTQNLIADNQARTGSLKITKNVTVTDGSSISLANGTYTFEIWKGDGSTKVSKKADGQTDIGTLQITVADGQADPAELTVDGLAPGDYLIKETASTNDGTIVDTSAAGYNAELGGFPITVSPEDMNGVKTAAFTNKYETTSLTVNKEWSDAADVDHSNDSISYTLYRIPYVIGANDEIVEYDPEEVESAAGYTKVLNANTDPAWTDTITDLPKTGKYTPEGGEAISVMYQYFVSEGSFEGYKSNVSGGADNEGRTYSFAINNEPHSSFDKETEVNVEKQWKKADVTGDQNAHDNDSITFNILQKKYEIELYPVIINLINGDGTRSDLSRTIYMPKDCQLNFRPESQSNGEAHRVSVSGTNKDGSYLPRKTVYIQNANGGKEVTFRLQKQGDKWADEISGTQWIIVIYDNSHGGSVSQNDNMIAENDLGAWIEQKLQANELHEVTNDHAPYEYTMKLDESKNGTQILKYSEHAIGQPEGNDKAKWKGKVRKLPYYEKGDDGKFYTYTYEISEVKIGSEPVTELTGNDDFQGQTSGYLVNWEQDSQTGIWTITNQKKPSINITVKKLDVENLEAGTPLLPGAAFRLEKYTDKTYQNKDSAWTEQIKSDESNTGQFEFTALPEGYYQLVETTLPNGYVKTGDDPRFRVKMDNGSFVVVLIDVNGDEIQNADSASVKVDNTTLKVGNTPGTPLPNSGGPGTTWIYLLGAILFVGSTIALVSRRRTRMRMN